MLLATATALLLLGAAYDFTAPWENGLRGQNAAVYEDVFVRSFLQYGLGVTHAAPAFVVDNGGHLRCFWHWHHPPLYPLYLTAFAYVLGHHEWTLRLAHLFLFVPCVFALFALLRRTTGPLWAGAAVLLFATTPMVGYFGPMVVHDGTVMAFGLWTAAVFWRFAVAPSRRGFWATAGLFFVTTQLDFLGHLWGIALFLLALAAPQPRRSVIAVLQLIPVSLLSLLLVAVHYGTFLGGPIGFFDHMLRASEQAQEPPTLDALRATLGEVLVLYGAWPICALALVGLVALTLDRGRPRWRTVWFAVALAAPGTLGSLLFLRHFVAHAFWPMPAFAGLAVLAASAPIVGWRWLRATGGAGFLAGSRAGRLAGALLVLLGMATVAHGTIGTHRLVERFRPVDTGFPQMVAPAADLTTGCICAMTNRDVPMRAFLPGLMFLGGVDTAAKLDGWMAYGANNGFHGDVAFLLERAHADAGLIARLGQLATPQERGPLAVYRFRL